MRLSGLPSGCYSARANMFADAAGSTGQRRVQITI